MSGPEIFEDNLLSILDIYAAEIRAEFEVFSVEAVVERVDGSGSSGSSGPSGTLHYTPYLFVISKEGAMCFRWNLMSLTSYSIGFLFMDWQYRSTGAMLEAMEPDLEDLKQYLKQIGVLTTT